MSEMAMMPDGHPVPSEKMVWLKRIVLGLVVLGGLYGLWFAVKGLFEPHAPQKPAVTKIKILPDTPPPPPPPPPKEPPKEQPKEQPKEMKVEPPKPQEAPQPPAEALKMEGPAGDGPSPFSAGPVTNDYKGGEVATKKIGGTRSASFYAFYTNQLRTQIEDALARDKTLAVGKYKVVVHIWLTHEGKLERFELAGSSGVADTDERVKAALGAMQPMQEAPPEDMPQPIKLRITARSAG